MKSPEMEALDVLVGVWPTTLSDAAFDLPPEAAEMTTTVSWVGEAFVLVAWESPGGGNTFCLGRWEASEDAGATWLEDFDITFVRA